MWLLLALLGCDASTGDTDGPDGTPCEIGCEATVEAACDNGPDTIEACVSTCELLLEQACGIEYDALLACGDGSTVSCDAQGLPTVDACPEEEGAFRDCLNP